MREGIAIFCTIICLMCLGALAMYWFRMVVDGLLSIFGMLL